MGGEIVNTLGWSSARGPHRLFRYDPRLARFGKSIIKLAELPGLEIRIGGPGKQLQSNCPPTVGDDGKPRQWNDCDIIAELPEPALAFLEAALTGSPKRGVVINAKRPREKATGDTREAYAAAAAERECQAVASATPGERVRTLNRASFAAGAGEAPDALDERDAVLNLQLAARKCGLSEEVNRTIRSGLAAGKKNPRDLSHLAADPAGSKRRRGSVSAASRRRAATADSDSILLRLASVATLFHDRFGRNYAAVPVDGHTEVYEITSTGFQLWLKRRFYIEKNRPPRAQSFQDALGVLEAKARFDGPMEPVFIRVAEDTSRFYLDLGDEGRARRDRLPAGESSQPTGPVPPPGWTQTAARAGPRRSDRPAEELR